MVFINCNIRLFNVTTYFCSQRFVFQIIDASFLTTIILNGSNGIPNPEPV
jgi:hypothetical protein